MNTQSKHFFLDELELHIFTGEWAPSVASVHSVLDLYNVYTVDLL
jgi:hypothetical protein